MLINGEKRFCNFSGSSLSFCEILFSLGLLNFIHGIFHDYADVTMQATEIRAKEWRKLPASEKKQYIDRANDLRPKEPEQAPKRRTGGLVKFY